MGIAYSTDEFDELKEDGENEKSMLIEGDSWVSHPLVRNYSDQFNRLSNDGFDILNLAVPGDTMLNIMDRHGSQIKKLIEVISDPQFSYKWDTIFLSAIGNDIIGPEIRYFVENKNDNPDLYGRQLLNGFFRRVLDEIKGDYEEFIKIVRSSNKNADTPIVTHSYCYMEPRAVGTHLFGHMFNEGWVSVYLKDKGIDSIKEQIDLVEGLLTECYNIMNSISDSKFLVVDTREFLSVNGKPQTDLFFDEIHPNSKGFKIVSKNIIDEATQKGFWCS